MTSPVSKSVASHAELFDVPGHAVIGTTCEGHIVYWNDQATTLFGWPRSEVMGRNVIEVTPSETAIAKAQEIMESLRRGEPWSGWFQLRTRDGAEFLASVTDMPVRDAAGELIGIVGVTRTPSVRSNSLSRTL